jgi:DNA end-binding protein Ku
MAPRVVWKGYLSLARVSCAVRLHPAVVRMDRLGLQPVNRTTLNRVQMRPYDPQTGKEISRDALLRGYEFGPGRFVVIEDRELAELTVESSRNIVLDRFIAPGAIDMAYLDVPYFVVPDAASSAAPFALIRAGMVRAGRVGVGRVVLGGREWAALVAPRGRGLLLTTLRAAAEVRSDEAFYGSDAEPPPEAAMVESAAEIIARLGTSFDPRRDFRERYQEALFQLVQAKLKNEKPIFPAPPPPVRIIALAEAVAASLKPGETSAAAAARPHTTALRQ